MLKKLAACPRQNGLAKALRELGRIERTLSTLDWLEDPVLRRRSHGGLNKGKSHHSLKRAVFFNRLGGLRDRTFENQSYPASGLNLVAAAVILWNAVYVARAVDALRARDEIVPDDLLAHVAPLGWEHVGLTGVTLSQARTSSVRSAIRKPRPSNSPLSGQFRADSAMTPIGAAGHPSAGAKPQKRAISRAAQRPSSTKRGSSGAGRPQGGLASGSTGTAWGRPSTK